MIFYTDAHKNAQAATQSPLTHTRIGYHSYTLELLPTAVTVSSEQDGAPGDAPLRTETQEYWQPSSLPATWTVEFGSLIEMDYTALLGFDLTGLDVLVETNDGSEDSNGLIWETFARLGNQNDDSPMMFLDDARDAVRMRYTIEETTDASGDMPKIAVIFAGMVLAMQRATSQGVTPPMLARATELYSGMSLNGQYLGQDFKRHGVEPAADFKNLTAAWYRQYFDPFAKAAREQPFFYAWRPESYPADVVYAWATRDIRPVNMKMHYMQVAWQMRGTGHEGVEE